MEGESRNRLLFLGNVVERFLYCNPRVKLEADTSAGRLYLTE